MTKHRYPVRPDAQAFDEIRIVTVPRYKTSGLSGDEWRISAVVRFFRKGELVHEEARSNIEVAARHLAFMYDRAVDDGKGYFAGVGGKCDQEGCSEDATVFYRMKESVCNRCGAKSDPKRGYLGDDTVVVRKFCQKHSIRGDCSLEDTDANYELIEGTPGRVPIGDVSPSGTVAVEADLNNLDELPGKIRRAVRGEPGDGC